MVQPQSAAFQPGRFNEAGALLGRSAPLLQFLEAALDHVASDGREAVEEEEAVAVVGLVQEAAGGEALGLSLVNFPARVLRAQAHARGAPERRVNLADREAAPPAPLPALGGEYRR